MIFVRCQNEFFKDIVVIDSYRNINEANLKKSLMSAIHIGKLKIKQKFNQIASSRCKHAMYRVSRKSLNDFEDQFISYI